jgi:hypothetical protein
VTVSWEATPAREVLLAPDPRVPSSPTTPLPGTILPLADEPPLPPHHEPADQTTTAPDRETVDEVVSDLVAALRRATTIAEDALPQPPTPGSPASDAVPRDLQLVQNLEDVGDGPPTARDRAEIRRTAELGRQVDAREILRAQRVLSQAALRAQAQLEAVPIDDVPTREGTCADGPVVAETRRPGGVPPPLVSPLVAHPRCQVVVGGPGSNVYHEDVGLLVDVGGQDIYRNNAGAWSPPAFDCGRLTASAWNGVSMALDLGGADDTYNATRAPFHATQGSGIFGHGFLMDAGGSDTYVAREEKSTACSYLEAQGTGLWGTGTLWDRGNGMDSYRSPDDAQGVGRLGTGLLLDEGG